MSNVIEKKSGMLEKKCIPVVNCFLVSLAYTKNIPTMHGSYLDNSVVS
jgi:hypothetical protein